MLIAALVLLALVIFVAGILVGRRYPNAATKLHDLANAAKKAAGQ